MPQHVKREFKIDCRNLLQKLEQMKRENRKIVYLDEVNFTKRSVSLKEWSQKNSNLTIDSKDIYIGYRSVIASITESEGLGYRQIYDKAITSDNFADYVEILSRRYPTRKLALFMDQLNVHKSNVVKEVYGKHKIIPIFNVAYSPQFNPIEAIFSKVKAVFNARRLNCLVNKIGFNIVNTIGIAFRAV